LIWFFAGEFGYRFDIDDFIKVSHVGIWYS